MCAAATANRPCRIVAAAAVAGRAVLRHLAMLDRIQPLSGSDMCVRSVLRDQAAAYLFEIIRILFFLPDLCIIFAVSLLMLMNVVCMMEMRI